MVEMEDLEVVTKRKPSEDELRDLMFWKVAKYVKSNAIVYCKDSMTVGVGAGQSVFTLQKLRVLKQLMRTLK